MITLKNIILALIYSSLCHAKGSGYSSRGINSQSRSVRGNQVETGYRNNYIATSYFILWSHGGYQRRSHLYKEKDPSQSDDFVCTNNKRIKEDKVCDWIDDCGDASDEIIPVPCQGPPSRREKLLYIGSSIALLLWCLSIVAGHYQPKLKSKLQSKPQQVTNTRKWPNTEFREDEPVMLCSQLVAPALLLFISAIFAIVSHSTNTSILPAFYITIMVCALAAALVSCCLRCTDRYGATIRVACQPKNTLDETNLILELNPHQTGLCKLGGKKLMPCSNYVDGAWESPTDPY